MVVYGSQAILIQLYSTKMAILTTFPTHLNVHSECIRNRPVLPMTGSRNTKYPECTIFRVVQFAMEVRSTRSDMPDVSDQTCQMCQIGQIGAIQ